MILVTGGAGFIGSHIVDTLIRQGQKVRVLDNLSTGKKENLEEATGCSLDTFLGPSPEPKQYSLGEQGEFLCGDVTDLSTCRMACQGVTYVFHQAALGSVQRSIEDPLQTHHANITGTLNILQAAKEAGVKRVLYASSSSIYGNIGENPDEILPKKETLPPNPQSPYAISKLAGEHYCRVFSKVYGLEAVSLRYFNVFGPRQDSNSAYAAVIPRFIMALLKNEPPLIYGDGHQSRDFTYVENVVQANLLAMENPGISGETMNIACGHRITINDLFSTLRKVSGAMGYPQYGAARLGEVRHSLADIRLAQELLDYRVEVGFKAGLQRTWEWFQKRRIPLPT